jgi:hypothetical protein
MGCGESDYGVERGDFLLPAVLRTVIDRRRTVQYIAKERDANGLSLDQPHRAELVMYHSHRLNTLDVP